MECPKCGHKTRVIDTRHYPSAVRRIRNCTNPACNNIIRTWEEIIENKRVQ